MRIASIMSPGPSNKGSYDPNIALKFFVDGEASKNLIAAPLSAQKNLGIHLHIHNLHALICQIPVS